MRAALGAFSLTLFSLLLACSDVEPGQVHVVNLARGDAPLHVQLCRDAFRDCHEVEVQCGAIGPWLRLEPGVWHVRVAHAEKPLTAFDYGVARGSVYALVLYGVADGRVQSSLLARAKRFLGGMDEPVVDGYQLAHRMVDMRAPAEGDPAVLRLAHMAPGLVAVEGELSLGDERTQLSPQRYGTVGKKAHLELGNVHLVLRAAGSPLTLAERDLDLSPPVTSVIYVAAERGSELDVVVDQNPSGTSQRGEE